MNDSSRVESCSKNAESRSPGQKGRRMMSSVSAAHELTRGLGDLLAPDSPCKVKLDRLYRELTKRLPKITRRRVRALFFAEVARIDYEEMLALKELRAEEELKGARRQFAASAIVLASHYAEIGSTAA
ncbi:MAG: hypothetical protein E5X19_05345 [Mesorhizobium sp.]|nr:MAG: hypothetical protein E5X19_05345 [Mesorhizobium sp.]